jgi:hypothetical protein
MKVRGRRGRGKEERREIRRIERRENGHKPTDRGRMTEEKKGMNIENGERGKGQGKKRGE